MKRGKKKKKSNKKLAFLLIAIFLVFAFALSFVNVTDSGNEVDKSITGYSFIGDLFAKWSEGGIDINIAKYLLWIVLSVLIFAILTAAKFPRKKDVFIRLVIAIPVSFLAIAYITPSELFTLLTAYTALGLTLSIFLPFIIIFWGSAALLGGKQTVAKILGQLILWFLFTGFLIYKLIVGYQNEIALSWGIRIVMFAALIVSGLILIFNKGYRRFVRNLGLEVKAATAQEGITDAQISKERARTEEQDDKAMKDLRDVM